MEIPQEIMDRIFKEIMDEQRVLKESMKGKQATFDDLERGTLHLGKEFERRVLEAALEEEQKRHAGVKKNASNAKRHSSIED